MKASLRDSEREKWTKVFIADIMSSDPEDDNIMIIKELPFQLESRSLLSCTANKLSSTSPTTDEKACGVSDHLVPTGVPKRSVVASYNEN